VPRRPTRHPGEPKTTVLLRGGTPSTSIEDLFKRVFWKSDFLAGEAQGFWKEVKKTEPTGLPIQAWKDWTVKRDMSVGQFYNMIHGLLGAGLLQRQGSKWHLSEGFTRELREMLKAYEYER
jgi:hypothetical protein